MTCFIELLYINNDACKVTLDNYLVESNKLNGQQFKFLKSILNRRKRTDFIFEVEINSRDFSELVQRI